MVALGLRCCMRAFSPFAEWELLFVAGPGLLTVVASRCGAQVLGVRASVVEAQGHSNYGIRA